MPGGEYGGEVAREFVEKVCALLEGNYGFHVYITSYEGPEAASVLVGTERVKFDIVLDQKTKDPAQNSIPLGPCLWNIWSKQFLTNTIPIIT